MSETPSSLAVSLNVSSIGLPCISVMRGRIGAQSSLGMIQSQGLICGMRGIAPTEGRRRV